MKVVHISTVYVLMPLLAFMLSQRGISDPLNIILLAIHDYVCLACCSVLSKEKVSF
jgi:hypothetical protein